MANRWTKEEEDFLREHYKYGNIEWCAEQLNRSVCGTQHRAKILGINATRKYTDDDIKWLKRNYKIDIDKCAKHFGISRKSVIGLAHRYGIESGRYLTKKERQYVQNHIGILSYEHMGNRIGRSRECIAKYASLSSNSLYFNDKNRINSNEVDRLLGVYYGRTASELKAKGLKVHKIGRNVLVDINDLLEFMKNNPGAWDATKCEAWFFDKYDWFQEKRKIDRKKADEKRWGQYYEV